MSELLSPVLEWLPQEKGTGVAAWRRTPGTRIDLHCHSTFSLERIRWLPGIVYHPLSEPEEVYDLAKARGMDFVTITDHDTIDGCRALRDRRGELPDFVFGEEVSVRFPEDGTIVHVNVYDHDEKQHDEIQRLRDNIYELVDYLRAQQKLYVLNHMTWTAQHRVLSSRQIEAVLELFDVFEGLNGARSYAHNAFTWCATQGRAKVLVGGSDSHTQRVGTTYTLTQGDTVAEMLANVRAGNALPCGAFGTPEKLREDVWLVFHKAVERRLTEGRSRLDRALWHTVHGIAKRLYPLVCLGYGKRQDSLIRGFVEALPA